MNWETLLCLGDSITIGSRSYLAYPEYCAAALSERTQKSWNVINHATAGFATIDLVRSIDAGFADLKAVKPEMITILIGTNDLKAPTSEEDFRIAYTQLVVKAQLIGGHRNIALIEIPELLSGVMLPYRLDMNFKIARYNHIIRELAATTGLLYFRIDALQEHFYDGVHLNDEGSKAWGEKLAEFVIGLRTECYVTTEQLKVL